MARKQKQNGRTFASGYAGWGGGSWGGWAGWGKTTAADLQQEMAGTASVFGRDKGVRVEFRGTEAKSEQGVVTFPHLDPSITFDTDEVKLFRGWVDSEAAITRFSDANVMHEVKALHEKTNLRLYQLFKSIESARVEMKYTELYSGAGKNLAAVSSKVFEQAKTVAERKEDFYPTAINMFARNRMDGVFNYLDCNEMEKIVDRQLIDRWIDKIETLETTEQSMALARSILDEMNNPPPLPQQNQQQGSGEGGEKGKQGEKSDDQAGMSSNQSGDSKGDDSGDSEKDKNKGGDKSDDSEGDEQDSQGGGQGEGEEDSDQQHDEGKSGDQHAIPTAKKSGPALHQPKPISLESIIDNIIKDAKEHKEKERSYDYSDEDGPYIPVTTKYDRMFHWKDDKWDEDVSIYTRAIDKMGAELATSKRKMELMIAATQKISWDSMKERGRLDSKRLVGAYQGDQNVFKIKRDESDLDTAVAICIDLSGSMGRSGKSTQAMMSAIVLSELLSKIGVPFEITGFDASMSGLADYEKSDIFSICREMYDYARIEPIRIQEFKRFGDKFFDARKYMHRIASLDGSGCNNVDGEAIMMSAKSLMRRPEKRKIMFVLSDGHPYADGNEHRLRGHLKRTVKDIERHQVELVGIGIMTDAVREFYPNYVVVKNSENLPSTMLKMLGEKLLPSEKGKRKAA